MQITQLEYAVMSQLLRGDCAVLKALRDQFSVSRVKSREATGVGFYLNFDVSNDFPGVHVELECKRDFEVGDVEAEIDSLQHGAGFVLFIRDGRISFLEGYTYDEPWPDEVKNFSLRYSSGEVRDLDELQRQWQKG
jgi:hypothetical protein